MNTLWKVLIWTTILSVWAFNSVFAAGDLSELLWTPSPTTQSSTTVNTVTGASWSTTSTPTTSNTQTAWDLSSLLWNSSTTPVVNTTPVSNTNTVSNTTTAGDLWNLLWGSTLPVNTSVVSAIETNWTKTVVIDWYSSDLLIELEGSWVYNKSNVTVSNVSNWTKVAVSNFIASTNVKDIKDWENVSWKFYLSIQENVSKVEISVKWFNVNRVVKYINRDTNQVEEVAKITFSNSVWNSNVITPTTNTPTVVNVPTSVNNNVWNTGIEDHPLLILMFMMLLSAWYIWAKRKQYI